MSENEQSEIFASNKTSGDCISDFRASRPKPSAGVHSNALLPDLCHVENLKSSNIKSLLTEKDKGIESLTSDDTLDTDPRIKKLKAECKYCSCIESQYDHNTCCIHFGYFRLILQKILHSIPFHISVSLLVMIDVIIVVLELTIESRELSNCINEADCNNTCENRIELPVSGENNETERLVCGFIGLSRLCIPESEKGVNISRIFSIITITILSTFLVEMAVKLFAFGFQIFLKLYEVFDMILVISSFVITIVEFVYEENEILILSELLIMLRLWRIVKVITSSVATYSTVKHMQHHKKKKELYAREAKNIKIFIDDYEFARSEVLRMRQVLLKMQVNPFPDEYGLSLAEVNKLGSN